MELIVQFPWYSYKRWRYVLCSMSLTSIPKYECATNCSWYLLWKNAAGIIICGYFDCSFENISVTVQSCAVKCLPYNKILMEEISCGQQHNSSSDMMWCSDTETLYSESKFSWYTKFRKYMKPNQKTYLYIFGLPLVSLCVDACYKNNYVQCILQALLS
jgi:hypothetical protein